MAPPTWKLVLTTEEGSQFSSRQFKSNLCPCQCCWCNKCDFKRLPEDAIRSMLPRLFPSDDTKPQPLWSLVLIFIDGSEFPSRPLKPVVGLCRYCWCKQRGNQQIQESDLRAFESFYSQEAADSLKELLDSTKNEPNGGTGGFFLERGEILEESETSASVNNSTADSSYEPVLLKRALLQKNTKNPNNFAQDSDDELFQSASDEDQTSSNVEDEDPASRESGASDDQRQETFTKKKSSERPKTVHTSKRPYQCDKCPNTFTRLNHLQVHKRIHCEHESVRYRPYKCKECPSAFSHSGQFEDHKRRTHSCNNTPKMDKQDHRSGKTEVMKCIKKKRTCLKCNRSFEDEQALYWHTKKEHNQSRLFKCGFCPSRFKNENQQIIHQRTHKDKKTGKYSCEKCEYSSIYAKSVMNHMSSHSRNTNVKIGEIGWTDRSNSKIPRNQKSGKSAKSVRFATATGVNNTGKSFSSTSTLNDQQKNPNIVTMGAIAVYESDPNEQLIIELAGDSTWTGNETGEDEHTNEASDEHEDVNEAPSPIPRAKRNRVLPNRRKLLKPSQNRVAGSKQQLPLNRCKLKKRWCSECFKSFERKESLDEHLKEHNPTHSFKCYFCSARFRTRKEKFTHQGSHKDTTGRYKCSHCKFSIVHADKMYKHMRTHTGEKPFKCDECDYSCALSETLERHKVKAHRKDTGNVVI